MTRLINGDVDTATVEVRGCMVFPVQNNRLILDHILAVGGVHALGGHHGGVDQHHGKGYHHPSWFEADHDVVIGVLFKAIVVEAEAGFDPELVTAT